MEPDDGRDDDGEFRSPPPRDDRVWLHPSELAEPGSRRGGRAWLIVALSGTTGALLAIGVIAAGGGLHGRVRDRPEGVVALAAGPRVLDVARQIRPAVVEVLVDRDHHVRRGAGVVFRGDGYVMTNIDVVGAARDVTVVLNSGRRLKGRVVGADPESNVAVVHVPVSNLPMPRVGNVTGLKEGEMAIALEAKRGSGRWATLCTVIGLHHKVAVGNDRFLLDMISTDAPVVAAASGGPLLDSTGALIGIRTNPAPDGISAERAGFATPIDFAHLIADQLATTGSVSRAWLGIEGTDLDGTTATELKLQGGAVVGEVVEGSPAHRGGLIARDVIVGVDGHAVDTMSTLVVLLRSHRPGEVVLLEVVRGGKREALRVSLEARPVHS